ncbi:PREDICTED: protein FAR1-RELATED SEQUENCE 5-like [Fragaria vesca subsp. vesca]|uniref:protein FAR1-RELATED SEQUENCE 5-like n=1 Tax=Fragaria vesca subsp. vesca TaxID=101020 RepID=UPI0002C327BD|nr:PREDICTED: protein FAR1-RELATED SEQUENCE 5-like [Fragaria vesca subsp. vesca]
MNTTGRSEGTNSFFDDFVTSTTNLREFVVKYEQALQKIVTRESSEDFTSEHKYRIVNDDDFLLKHAAHVYTRNIFEKFKSEWTRVKRIKVEERGSDDQFHRYSVMKKINNSQEFLVELNLQTHEGKCECQNFEFVGIICRHIMKVFVRQDIDAIPSHFILPRWRQGANKFRVTDSEALVHNDGKEQSEALRFSHMCRRATQLACYAAPSDEAYLIYMDGLDELSKKNSEVNKVSQEDVMESHDNAFQDEAANICTSKSSEPLLLDPNILKTKGRKKDMDENNRRVTKSSKRIKDDMELAQSKKRKCTMCQQPGHNRLTCPLNSAAKRKTVVSTNQGSQNMQELPAVSDKEDSDEEDSDNNHEE